MNRFLPQAIIIAGVGDEESTFWVQLLVIVFVGALWGLYNLVKSRKRHFAESYSDDENYYEQPRRYGPLRKLVVLYENIFHKQRKKKFEGVYERGLFAKPAVEVISSETVLREDVKKVPVRRKKRDLHSGLELLPLDFLLRAVENTDSDDSNDLIMQKIYFNELVRRIRLTAVNSQVLKAYAIDKNKQYDKVIQCEALQELARRTSHENKPKRSEQAVGVGA